MSKFLNQLTEALRNIPQDLPGEDKWGEQGRIVIVINLDDDGYNQVLIDEEGNPVYIAGNKSLPPGWMPSKEDLHYGFPKPQKPSNEDIDAIPDNIKREFFGWEDPTQVTEALRNIPKDLPGEDEWGEIMHTDPGQIVDDMEYTIETLTYGTNTLKSDWEAGQIDTRVWVEGRIELLRQAFEFAKKLPETTDSHLTPLKPDIWDAIANTIFSNRHEVQGPELPGQKEQLLRLIPKFERAVWEYENVKKANI